MHETRSVLGIRLDLYIVSTSCTTTITRGKISESTRRQAPVDCDSCDFVEAVANRVSDENGVWILSAHFR